MSKVVFSVSELNLAAQKLLEDCFPSIWVEGEISNLARPTSGHLYFSLKDQKAQIRCAMFRNRTIGLAFQPQNGLLVQIEAKVSLYPDRGDYQLIVDKMEMAGDGLLRKAYEALVATLKKEGLFEEKWKKPLPTLPRQIGIITSPTGAAIRDILSVLQRRFPQIPIILYPTKVQGNDAKFEIVKAIELANFHQAADILILARGGGSLEDLWPFNEEMVARAIFASTLPIVTGIGHEIDFTIADLVGDRRAPTPSAAAELVVPLQSQWLKQFLELETRLINAITKYLQHESQRLDWLIKRIRHPGHQIAQQIIILTSLRTRFYNAIRQYLKQKAFVLTNAVRTLETVSPLATLNRGYAIVSLKSSGMIVRTIKEVSAGDLLEVRVKDGVISATIND